MVEALDRHLERDLECEALLECLYELNELDQECFHVLTDADEPLTIDELTGAVGRERSTTYRSVQRLLEVGLVEKDQVNYDHGGYHHVYHLADPNRVATEMQQQVNDWYAQIGYLIGRFRNKYGDEETDLGSPPPVT